MSIRPAEVAHVAPDRHEILLLTELQKKVQGWVEDGGHCRLCDKDRLDGHLASCPLVQDALATLERLRDWD